MELVSDATTLKDFVVQKIHLAPMGWAQKYVQCTPKNLLKTCFARLLPRSTKQNSTSLLSKNQIKECLHFCSYLIKYEFSLERSVYYWHG